MAKGDKGKVVQVIGTVVAVEFDQNNLPEIFNALALENEGERFQVSNTLVMHRLDV